MFNVRRMLGNILKCFERPPVRKVLYKCSPFTEPKLVLWFGVWTGNARVCCGEREDDRVALADEEAGLASRDHG